MRAFTVGLVLLLAAPATAFGRGSPFPAGNSAVGQYVEVIPTASGGRPSSSVHAGSGSSSSQAAQSNPVTPSTQHALASQGKVGAEAAAVAEATAPRVTVGRLLQHRRGTAGSRSAPAASQPAVYSGPPAPKRSSTSQLVAALTGSATHGGLGTLMPVLLVAAAAGAVVIALRRRRQ